jgi:hypothetical protein
LIVDRVGALWRELAILVQTMVVVVACRRA